MIEQLIQGKTNSEKAQIKSREITKVPFVGVHNIKKLKIEITKVEEIPGGIQVFARAWKGGKQLGFGKDGSVDIERFRIFNPPVLVDDPNGEIVRVLFDEEVNKKRTLKYDPLNAILKTLEHTISIVGKYNSNIIKNKIGNTTSTFYPDANPESTSVDGGVFENNTTGTNKTWAELIALPGNQFQDDSASGWACAIESDTTTDRWRSLMRSIFLFDTSAIGSDTIDSATLSLAGASKSDGLSITPDINIYSSAPASDTAIVAGDFDSLGSTAFSTPVSYANWNTDGTYSDFALNASGLSNINGSGISKFGARNASYDVAGSPPTWSSNQFSRLNAYFADQTGTTNDPKLVIEHTAVSTFTPSVMMF